MSTDVCIFIFFIYSWYRNRQIHLTGCIKFWFSIFYDNLSNEFVSYDIVYRGMSKKPSKMRIFLQKLQ